MFVDLSHVSRSLILPRDVDRIEATLHFGGNDPNLHWIEHPAFPGIPVAYSFTFRPTLGIAIPQESFDGTTYQIWAHDESYRTSPSPLDRLLSFLDYDPIPNLYHPDHALQSPDLTSYRSIADVAALHQLPLSDFLFNSTPPRPRTTFTYTDRVWVTQPDGTTELLPVIDGRPLASSDDLSRDTSGNLTYEDLLSITSTL